MFEFDPAKSEINKVKHGIDFTEAQLLWRDGDHIVIHAQSDIEPRFMAVGRIGDFMWAAICTLRGGDIRLISVRRARKDEVELYDSQKNNHC